LLNEQHKGFTPHQEWQTFPLGSHGFHDGAFGCVGAPKESTLGRFVVHLEEDTRFGLGHRSFTSGTASKDKFLWAKDISKSLSERRSDGDEQTEIPGTHSALKSWSLRRSLNAPSTLIMASTSQNIASGLAFEPLSSVAPVTSVQRILNSIGFPAAAETDSVSSWAFLFTWNFPGRVA